MSPRTLDPSLVWENETVSPCTPSTFLLSRNGPGHLGGGGGGSYAIVSSWVWLMVFRCFLVRKLILLSLRSRFQLMTMSTHCLRRLPWATDCPMSRLHSHAAESLQRASLYYHGEGRKAVLNISLASRSGTQCESQPRLSKTTGGSVLGSPASQTRKSPNLLTHEFCWNLLAPKRSTINADRAMCHKKVRTTYKMRHNITSCDFSLLSLVQGSVSVALSYLWICKSVLNILTPSTPAYKL